MLRRASRSCRPQDDQHGARSPNRGWSTAAAAAPSALLRGHQIDEMNKPAQCIKWYKCVRNRKCLSLFRFWKLARLSLVDHGESLFPSVEALMMLPIYADTFYIIFCSPPRCRLLLWLGSSLVSMLRKKGLCPKGKQRWSSGPLRWILKLCGCVCVYSDSDWKMVNGWLVIRFNYLLMIVK